MVQTLLDEAKALVLKGDVDAAIHKLMENLNGDFFHDETLFMLGNCFNAGGMYGAGAVLSHAAIEVRKAQGKPFPEALTNLGGCYKAVHKNDVAARIWGEALKQETMPRDRAKIMTNLAGVYINEGKPEAAIEWCDRALAEDVENHGAAVNRGIACLALGRWREGWDGWKHTYGAGDRRRRDYGVPEWDGSPGKVVIAYGDQGVGDEIFYASCLPDLARVSKRVILDCHPRFPALFARSFPEFTVHGTRKDLTELPWLRDCGAEAAVCVAELPSFFRNSDDDWGEGRAYLKADHEAIHGLIDGRTPAPRVGISWTGGSARTRTDQRSLPIEELVPILRARPDAQWFSLQYTPDAARRVCELEERTGIRISHYPGWVEHFDYDRTASFVRSLDLVVTVTTAAHDLASALGVPNWVLVPTGPPWRFQAKGETLPWYKSARLFRQEKDGDWSSVVNRIAEEISGF